MYVAIVIPNVTPLPFYYVSNMQFLTFKVITLKNWKSFDFPESDSIIVDPTFDAVISKKLLNYSHLFHIQ